jgi:transcriptional regulator with XRE-family HTH domain
MEIEDLILEAAGRRLLPPPEQRRRIREQANLTQCEVAGVLGTDASCISHYERGTREPRGEMRKAYGALLDRLRREVLS